jgi:hypothetical protein
MPVAISVAISSEHPYIQMSLRSDFYPYKTLTPMTTDAQQLAQLYKQIEACTTREETKTLLKEAAQLQQQIQLSRKLHLQHPSQP